MLQNNPNVKNIANGLQFNHESKIWEMITAVQTDLHLDVLHPAHNKAAVQAVLDDALAYMSSPGFFGTITVLGV